MAQRSFNTSLNFFSGISVEKLALKLGNFLKLYGESLQAMVQGYREVTMDSTNSYRFKRDKMGESLTVQDKIDRFEQKLRDLTNSHPETPKP
mmetsp:Transcript_2086/g.3688  ORF Transcript_2086/g.3688 Transcript_2086/m.3688 type:complete len:92 (-) Transcript_2086:70-345(-)